MNRLITLFLLSTLVCFFSCQKNNKALSDATTNQLHSDTVASPSPSSASEPGSSTKGAGLELNSTSVADVANSSIPFQRYASLLLGKWKLIHIYDPLTNTYRQVGPEESVSIHFTSDSTFVRSSSKDPEAELTFTMSVDTTMKAALLRVDENYAEFVRLSQADTMRMMLGMDAPTKTFARAE